MREREKERELRVRSQLVRGGKCSSLKSAGLIERKKDTDGRTSSVVNTVVVTFLVKGIKDRSTVIIQTHCCRSGGLLAWFTRYDFLPFLLSMDLELIYDSFGSNFSFFLLLHLVRRLSLV